MGRTTIHNLTLNMILVSVNIALGTHLVYNHGRTCIHFSYNLTGLCHLVYSVMYY